MSIIYDKNNKYFHLSNKNISYIINILPNNQIGQVYFGKRVTHLSNPNRFYETVYRDMSPVVDPEDITFSMDQVKQECSVFGRGDLRQTALGFTFNDGSRVTDFQYESHEIFNGKRLLDGLPSVRIEKEEEATSLWIKMKDQLSSLIVILQYTILEKENTIIRSYRIENSGSETIQLDSTLSLNLDLPDSNYDFLNLSGAWCRERHIERHPLHRGVQEVYSLRGHSSHQHNPFLSLVRPYTTENNGEAIGFGFIYSGNHLAQVDVDNYDNARVLMGIHPIGFCWPLAEKEIFQTPEVAIVYSDTGLNGMSQTFHRLSTNHLIRKEWRKKRRPILINNWEATYMDFNEDKLLTIAESAKELGVELFVLDDGWFGKRNTAKSSLGDWTPNLEKLPNSIAGLSKSIKKLGLQLGLWFEPEMISEASELFVKHPEWLLSDGNKPRSVGRYQYYLDLSKDEVVNYLFEKISLMVEEGDLSYIKWDLNRSMSEVFSQGESAERQGTIYHRTVLGMYRLHELLLTRFPELLIEGCASGGARFDLGMLYYTPQVWTSDNTDAVDRLKTQYGTSLIYPLSSIGSHVSASPNHQTNRSTSIKFRGDVAYFGTFGYELDTEQLTEEEKLEIKEQIKFAIETQSLIHEGTFYRLQSPFASNQMTWQVISENQKTGIVGIYRTLNFTNQGFGMVKLEGLIEDQKYQLTSQGYSEVFYGSELMALGLPITKLFSRPGDFLSVIINIQAIDE